MNLRDLVPRPQSRAAQYRLRLARRVGAALLAVWALSTLVAQLTRSGSTVEVLVATQAIEPGGSVNAASTRLLALPSTAVPSDAVRALSELASDQARIAISPGEVLTEQRVVGAPVPQLAAGSSAVSLPLPSGVASEWMRVGTAVDVYRPGSRSPLARAAIILEAPRARSGASFGSGDLSVTLAVTPEDIGTLMEEAGRSEGSNLVVVSSPKLTPTNAQSEVTAP